MIIRYIQLFISGIYFGLKFLLYRNAPVYLWIYNSRFPEFIFLLPIKLLNFHKSKIFIQFEDLPFARKQNFGVRGFLDSISTHVLSKISSSYSVVSKSMEHTLARRYLIDTKSIIIFPPLADQEYISIVSTRCQPFKSNLVNIMYAGGYSEEKGIYTLLDAFTRLPITNFNLNLYGPIPPYLSQKLSNIKNIVIHGLVDDLTLFESYSNSDVVVNPHHVITNEALIFPFKTIEILLCGSLPLLTPMPGLKTFPIPSVCLFEDSNALFHKLLNARSLYEDNRDQINSLAEELRSFSDPVSFSLSLNKFLISRYFEV